MLDGLHVSEDLNGEKYWEFWDNGRVTFYCSDIFKEKLMKHPKVIEEYEKHIERKTTCQ